MNNGDYPEEPNEDPGELPIEFPQNPDPYEPEPVDLPEPDDGC